MQQFDAQLTLARNEVDEAEQRVSSLRSAAGAAARTRVAEARSALDEAAALRTSDPGGSRRSGGVRF